MMNVHKTILELRRQLQVINEVIIALERLEPNRAPKHELVWFGKTSEN
jgi:hypothetical protein